MWSEYLVFNAWSGLAWTGLWFKMFREIPLLLLIGGMIKASRNISVSLGDLKQPEDCQDFLTRFEVNTTTAPLLK